MAGPRRAATRVVVIHWNASEGAERVERLRRSGFDARLHRPASGESRRGLRADPPEAVVIDLSRLPSQGRQVAVLLRQQRWSRSIAIVFVEGAPDKVAVLRQVLPDATYASWKTVRGALRRALRAPPRELVVPGSIGGYSGTPLAKKLGIKAGSFVVLLGAPQGFEATLAPLPEAVELATRARPGADRIVLFCRSRAELSRRFDMAARALAASGSVWLAWPKKGSALEGDLDQIFVRAFGLARGFVDYKICAIDSTWSGLCFSRRK